MRPKVTTIVLAAGQSQRMGAQNKLLLPVNGIPMIRHMALVYQEVTDGTVLVVTGHEADMVCDALRGTESETVFNPRYAQGQQTSVVCGLRAAEDADLLMIGLADQPFLTVRDLRDLLACHAARDHEKISVPVQGDQRGNPILVPADLRSRLLDEPKGPGCKQFTRKHSDRVQSVQVSSQGFFTDVDTPDAYAALAKCETEVLT